LAAIERNHVSKSEINVDTARGGCLTLRLLLLALLHRRLLATLSLASIDSIGSVGTILLVIITIFLRVNYTRRKQAHVSGKVQSTRFVFPSVVENRREKAAAAFSSADR
jgi:hypothetical protein